MAILGIPPPYRILILGVLLMIQLSCKTGNNSTSTVAPKIDSILTNIKANDLFNSETISKGIHFIGLDNDSTYLVLVDSFNVTVMEISDSNNKIVIRNDKFIEQVVCKDSSVILFNFEDKVINKLTFLEGSIHKHRITKIDIPSIFNDSIFCYSIFSAPLCAIDTNSFLIPYRAFNETPNMVDDYSTLYVSQSSKIFTIKKILPFASYIRKSYDYYKSILLSFDSKSNTIFYTFQKCSYLYSFSISTNKIDSVKIENFKSVEYDSTKVKDHTYLRKYMAETDLNTNISIDESSRIYVVTKNSQDEVMNSEINIYNNKLEKLLNYETKQELYGTFAFTRKESFYILDTSNKYLKYTFFKQL